ncbi:UDP-N-acetylmuramate--L-alanine ligase [Schlesneria sp. DSM 10557]|uniref:UDP-N-acetylmuramate--L-alanine ligase n=1 Tax=Schlesneria sp. DSM 10557 TaxID=3044399 RepID=UPI00359F6ADE
MNSDSPASAHLVGICGSGMRALAEVLMDQGWSLSGSDLQPAPPAIQKLMNRGLLFRHGHAAQNIPPRTAQLVYSPAIRPDNVERKEAERRGIPQQSYSQRVSQLARPGAAVCIAGTHGKSTTTAMTAKILERANRLSGVVLGAEMCDSGRSGWIGAGDLFVAESCEFQQSFLDFHPRYNVILSVEPDHFDCYPTLPALETAFTRFASQTCGDGVLLFNADSETSTSVARHASTSARRTSFGTSLAADWRATGITQTSVGTEFQLLHHGHPISRINLPLHGLHNVGNAMAAAAITAEIGVSVETIQQGLTDFPGIRRRLERVGECRGTQLFDDYAHHPTAVKITLQTLRDIAGAARLWCVFQPHQVLRTVTLMNEFAASFAMADEVIIAPVYAARESVNQEPHAIAGQLAERISANGVKARFYPSLDQIVNTLEDAMRPGDFIVTMGAGDIDRIHYEFTRRVQ